MKIGFCYYSLLFSGPGEYQRDTQCYYQLKLAEPGILFSVFCGGTERTLQDEGGAVEN